MLKSLVENGVLILENAGAPSDGSTGAGFAGPGSLIVDRTNKKLYMNTGTKASPTWENLSDLDAADIDAGAVRRTHLGIAVINKTGSTIVADKLVALTSVDATSGLPKIVLADADVAAHDQIFVTTASILNNATGTVVKGATSAATLNTNSASAAGDAVYLDTTAGGFAHSAPTGATARVIVVGYVLVKSATVGQILWSIEGVRKVGTDDIQINALGGASAAELSVLAGVTPGTAVASKALVADANKDLDAAALRSRILGAGNNYKLARGVSAVTGTATVATGLTTVVAVVATAQDDLDGDALAGVSATIGDQAGTPAAGSVILKCWKVTTGGAAGNPTLIAATAAKNVNWIAIGV